MVLKPWVPLVPDLGFLQVAGRGIAPLPDLKIAPVRRPVVVPGIEDDEELELTRLEITLKAFLEELSRRSPDPIEYMEPGADRLDPDDWEVDINETPYQDYPAGLETMLHDGDTVTIRILAQGGG